MGKLSVVWMSLTLFVLAENTAVSDVLLQQQCLHCHQQQQIPSSLIYKRYLMKYSTEKRMEDAMFAYLKNPSKIFSIMPAPFFLKFPMKEKSELDERTLRSHIQAYLKKYDIKKRLILEE